MEWRSAELNMKQPACSLADRLWLGGDQAVMLNVLGASCEPEAHG